MFFAYIGFDIVATAAEETKNPRRDMPIGIFGSLGVCTVLYVAVFLVVTGMVKYTDIKVDAPLAEAFRSVGHPAFATVISLGALVGLTSVILVLMLGQSRVFFAMSRDRLLPSAFARVSSRFGTPLRTTMLTGVVVAAIATFVPLTALAELVNIGTLFAFVLVAIGVLVLRRTRPGLRRAFRCPWVPVVPALAVLSALYLMLTFLPRHGSGSWSGWCWAWWCTSSTVHGAADLQPIRTTPPIATRPTGGARPPRGLNRRTKAVEQVDRVSCRVTGNPLQWMWGPRRSRRPRQSIVGVVALSVPSAPAPVRRPRLAVRPARSRRRRDR